MLPPEHPDRIQIAFDDHRLVNNAGLLLPATLGKVGRRRVTPVNEALSLRPPSEPDVRLSPHPALQCLILRPK